MGLNGLKKKYIYIQQYEYLLGQSCILNVKFIKKEKGITNNSLKA